MLVLPPDSHRFCVAPMIDITHRHCRYFYRLLTKKTRLYTEMITAQALCFGKNPERLLRQAPNEQEGAVALQLGGSDPKLLARSAQMGLDFGYHEINFNVGCPSDRVQSGRFGACLMAEPNVVAECMAAMHAAVGHKIPVTLKTRIGIDDHDSYEFLCTLIETVAQAGCEVFIIHARKAWLKGLSPKENREIPPLHYDVVYKLKRDYPNFKWILNGGLKTLAECDAPLAQLDGVMLGRAPHENPWMLTQVDASLFDNSDRLNPCLTRQSVWNQMVEYAITNIENGERISPILHALLGLYHGEHGAKQWRRNLTLQMQNGIF